MMTESIPEIKSIVVPILKQHQAIRAGLFGSLIRGEATSASDIDILVELPLKKSLFDFVDLKLALEDALGRSVDLVDYSTLHHLLKEQILNEEVPIYMNRDSRLFVQDILESIDKIETYTQGLTIQNFFESDQTQDAVMRRFEIIGEATKNLPKEVRDAYPDIPWRTMAGLRDVLIHSYFKINSELVWDVIDQQLPNLKAQIQHVFDDLSARQDSPN